ncbi:MAG TPA: PDZ domain-containing protein [Thermoanaerobaculia bacterium]
MRNGKVFRAAAWGLAFGLAALAGATAARAETGDEKEKKVEKRRIVYVDKDGKQRVWEGDGLLMKRGFLGVGLTEMTPELRTHFGAPEDAGAMVSKVEPGSPAEKAGIRVGDILTSVDGKDVESSWDVMATIRRLDGGEQVPIEVWRDGKVQTLTATITEKERSELDMGPFMWKSENGEPLMFRMPKGEALKGFESFKIPASPREIELEKKLKDLEKRLDELEKQLGKQKG